MITVSDEYIVVGMVRVTVVPEIDTVDGELVAPLIDIMKSVVVGRLFSSRGSLYVMYILVPFVDVVADERVGAVMSGPALKMEMRLPAPEP